MIRPIVRDPMFLGRKSRPATPEDLGIASDLRETLFAHRDGCVGMAANMIGESVRILVADAGGKILTVMNPEIVSASGAYETEEGCLSLPGVRKTKRYRRIEIRYRDENFRSKTGEFTGFTAQIIQHEIDHMNGILI